MSDMKGNPILISPPNSEDFTRIPVNYGQPNLQPPAVIRISVAPKKSLIDAYVLGLVLGLFGAHHFYLRRPWFGIAYMLTFGLLGVGYIVDLLRMPWLVARANKKLENPTPEEERSLFDAYILWFPFGLLGFHLFYLKKPGQGMLYLCTFGLLGIGFLVDLFRMPSLVRAANNPEEADMHHPKCLCTAYVFGLSPLGIFGAHHYYLNRPLWGLLYTLTFGILGIGWLFDWFRMSVLVERTNAILAKEEDHWTRHVDDAYILWFPLLGIMGFHHFYLRRPGWGVIYLFSFGLLGIGWLIDFCRMPCLVKDCNKLHSDSLCIISTVHGQVACTVPVVSTLAVPSYQISPNNGAAANQPPPYSYQNYAVGYPPQTYIGQSGAAANGYTNEGYGSGVPATVPPMPPSYNETVTIPEKPGFPQDDTSQKK